ncbi:MAG: molybdopterin-dependent oxidoreductase, partial [Solirubrobacteraceae bacterium]|nr:molybdopterin-dependent oxidoreductase [Solirubrobacteraceae bacterium]
GLAGEDAAGKDGSGLFEIPATTNGRGLREVGVLPDATSGLRPVTKTGLPLPEIAGALADGSLTGLLTVGTDPLADLQGRPAWRAALLKADYVAVSGFLTEGVATYADVVFPAEAPAEQEGTLTHPDGRLQRARPAIKRPEGVRSGWWVLAQLASRLGDRTPLFTAGMVYAELVDDVAFYAGITLDAIGGKGLRWQAAAAAGAWPKGTTQLTSESEPAVVPSANGTLRLSRAGSMWRIPEVAASPALRFMVPTADARLAPADAERLELTEGAAATLAVDGVEIAVTTRLDSRVPVGTVVAQAGVPGGGADELPLGPVEVRKA